MHNFFKMYDIASPACSYRHIDMSNLHSIGTIYVVSFNIRLN